MLERRGGFFCAFFLCGKNVIKMKLKTNTSLLVLYVCSWPGLEDHSSGPGIVSRSLSRGESASLSSKHGLWKKKGRKKNKIIMKMEMVRMYSVYVCGV